MERKGEGKTENCQWRKLATGKPGKVLLNNNEIPSSQSEESILKTVIDSKLIGGKKGLSNTYQHEKKVKIGEDMIKIDKVINRRENAS